jgi:hypothetical protein
VDADGDSQMQTERKAKESKLQTESNKTGNVGIEDSYYVQCPFGKVTVMTVTH